MPGKDVSTPEKGPPGSFKNRFYKFQSSIYGQVIYIITLLSFILFLSFNFIFRSVSEDYVKNVVYQIGNNIGLLVEGNLYRSMLENDKKGLQNSLVLINSMSGIDNVSLYDQKDSLVYSSILPGDVEYESQNCIGCHNNMEEMFPLLEKSYNIISSESSCKMNNLEDDNRHLMIKSPILNQRSCFTAACHAHQESEKTLGSLVIKLPLEDIDKAVNRYSAEFFILATFVTILLVAFLIFFTTIKIRKPLNAIVKASRAVANGDHSTRLELMPKQLGDIRMVSLAFNEMLDNLNAATRELQNWSHQLEYKVEKKSEELEEVQNELIHIEKIASIGKLSSSVAHELNNPLSGILVYTKLVHKQLSNLDLDPKKKASMLKRLKSIENETKHCGDIVKGLLDFSRKDQKDFEASHLHDILRETADLMAHPIEISNNSFLKDFAASADQIYCNPNQIKQACVALLVNATEAVSDNGEILLKTYNPDEENIVIQIEDNGTGISPEDMAHIFEPFFSTKQGESGIGLGLAIVHGIISSHKGKIDVDSEQGKGTTISITLPLGKK